MTNELNRVHQAEAGDSDGEMRNTLGWSESVRSLELNEFMPVHLVKRQFGARTVVCGRSLLSLKKSARIKIRAIQLFKKKQAGQKKVYNIIRCINLYYNKINVSYPKLRGIVSYSKK